MMRARPSADLPANTLSPGVADILIADGHPAIVSVKPIVSDSGEIAQVPGEEFVHISVRHLDGSFLAKIRTDYGIDGARFVWTNSPGPGESVQPLRSRNGKVVGFVNWRPFAPGAIVFTRLAPVLLLAFLILGALVLVLIGRITNRTRQLRDSKAAVQHLAFHDYLTGLPNRALFDDRLDHALAIYRGTAEHRVALLYLDLDRFKTVNDTLGHPAGDTLIREFALRLLGVIRVTDTAARLGGDEFAIIQTELSSPAETETLCARIIEVASEPFLIEGSTVFIRSQVSESHSPGRTGSTRPNSPERRISHSTSRNHRGGDGIPCSIRAWMNRSAPGKRPSETYGKRSKRAISSRSAINRNSRPDPARSWEWRHSSAGYIRRAAR